MGAKFDREAPRFIADLVHDAQAGRFDKHGTYIRELTPEQAAGLPGQGAQESGWFEKVVEGGGGPGRGYFQHSFSRATGKQGLLAWLALKGWSLNSYEGNYSFVFRELLGYEGKRLFPKLLKCRTPEEAADIWCDEFERPAAATANKPLRREGARRALNLYLANPPAPTIWPTDEAVPMPVPSVPVPADPPAIPWYQSPVFVGALSAFLLSAFTAVQAYKPGVPIASQWDALTAPVLAALGSLIAAYKRGVATAQPITVTQANADKIAAEQPPVALQVPLEEPVRVTPADVSLNELPIGRVLEELPDLFKRLAPLIPVLGQVAGALELGRDVQRRIEEHKP